MRPLVHLNGLGEAIDAKFSRWNLTEAECKQARSIYSKAGLTERSALSAFFLEDLLTPIEGLGTGSEPP